MLLKRTLKLLITVNILIPFFCVAVPLGLGPEGDVMDYRYPLLKWALAHRTYPNFPWTYNDDYPALAECFMGLSLLITRWGPRIVSACAYASYVVASFRLATLLLPAGWPLLGTLIVASMNLVTTQDNLIMVDLFASGMALWSLVFLMQIWLQPDEAVTAAAGPVARKRRLLLVAGLFGGAAMASRYTQLAVVATLVAFHGLISVFSTPSSLRRGLKCALSDAAVYMAPALLVFAPWLVRNMIVNHDPLFPFFAGLFQAVNITPARELELKTIWGGYGLGTSLHDFLLMPYRFAFHPDAYDYSVGPYYTMALPWTFLLLAFKGKRRASIAGFLRQSAAPILMLVFTVVWFKTSRQGRFLLHVMPLAVFSAQQGMLQWIEFTRGVRLAKALTVFFLILGLAGTAKHLNKHRTEILDELDALRSGPRWSRSIHINQKEVVDWLNAHAAEGGKVVLIERTSNLALIDLDYLLVYPHVYSTSVYDFRNYAGAAAYYEDLRSAGARYLYTLSAESLGQMPRFPDGTSPWKLVYQAASGGCVYELRPL